jgi:hypothetical protein
MINCTFLKGYWLLHLNIDALSDMGMKIGLEVKREKCVLSHHQNAGQDHNINMANWSFETVAKIKYFGATLIKIAACNFVVT